jgi:nucleoside-triphosphatase
VQKVCKLLHDTGISTRGFFTEEIRDGRTRIGFDVVTLNGERGALARLSPAGAEAASGYAVGRYTVTLKSFETFALPVFPTQPNFEGILVLDEIGRMELLSDQFKKEVTKAFSNPSITVLATIPVRPTAFTESLKQTPNSVVLVVNRSNRDGLVHQVFDMLTNMTQSLS